MNNANYKFYARQIWMTIQFYKYSPKFIYYEIEN